MQFEENEFETPDSICHTHRCVLIYSLPRSIALVIFVLLVKANAVLFFMGRSILI
jgi:hypothetical protein